MEFRIGDDGWSPSLSGLVRLCFLEAFVVRSFISARYSINRGGSWAETMKDRLLLLF